MSYCTIAQLTDRYGEQFLLDLSFRGDTVPEEVDSDLFDRAIADADAEIDGYLKVRYALPLAETPRLVTDLSLRIAIYKAHGQTVADKIRDDYRDALKQLVQLSKGEIKLDDAEGIEPAGAGTSGVTTNAPARPLTHDTLKGFV